MGSFDSSLVSLVQQLESRVLLSSIAWDGGAGTSNWNDAANWVGDVRPGQNDDAQIGAAFSALTISSSADVAVYSVTTVLIFSVSAV